MSRPPSAAAPDARSVRLRSPILVSLWVSLALEAVGGLVIFFARLAAGTRPGELVHVAGGVALTFVYALYQWNHWHRVRPFRARLDYALGLIAALAMGLALLTGLALGVLWFGARAAGAPPDYPAWLSGAHNVMSMFVLTFVGAHFAAVLQRAASVAIARETRRS